MCNYCSFHQITMEAKERKLKVTKLPSVWKLGGWEVFVHPHTVKITAEAMDDSHKHHKYLKAWFMDIPDHPIC